MLKAGDKVVVMIEKTRIDAKIDYLVGSEKSVELYIGGGAYVGDFQRHDFFVEGQFAGVISDFYVKNNKIFPFLQNIHIYSNRVRSNFDIHIGSDKDRPTHLILTGPNGVGKTSALQAIRDALIGEGARGFRLPEGARAEVGAVPVAHLDPAEQYPFAQAAFMLDRFVFAWLPARRSLHAEVPPGARPIPWAELGGQGDRPFAAWFLQYLVNRRFDQLLALGEGDNESAGRIQRWMDGLLEEMRAIFEIPDLRLGFERSRYRFTFDYPDGRRVDFNDLPDGFSSVLAIWAEILMREEAWRQRHPNESDPPGVVIIDELETHLHLKLQRRILPFLSRMFPRYQFIVATHAPAILSSVDNAVIYDLGSHERVESRDLQGLRFGALMTGHFGLDEDLDLPSARDLSELTALARKPERTPDEDARLQHLSETLSARSQTLAAEVWLRTRPAGPR